MSNDLTKDEIVKMAREAGLWVTGFPTEHIENFVALCRAPLVAEVERLQETVRTYDKRIVALGCIAMEDVHRPSFGVKNCAEIARADRDDWKARALKAEQVGEPFGWYSAKEDDFMLDKIRKTHERLNSHTHRIGKYDLALYTTPPQPAAQEPTSAVPVVREMVEALSRNRIMAADSDGNYTKEVTPRIITDAIAAGQQYLKENGK